VSKTFFASTGSTYLVKSGVGTFYGITVNPVAGSTFVVADSADLGAAGPDFNLAVSTTSTIMKAGVYPANPVAAHFDAHGFQYENGLSVSFTSTANAVLAYD